MILILMIIVFFLGFIIPLKYENSDTLGMTRILSASMEPTVKVGDEIIYDKVDINKVKENDLIVYSFLSNEEEVLENVKILHRVKQVIKDENGNVKLVTKGDNTNQFDEFYITEKNFIGIYNHKTSLITNLFFYENL